MRLCYNENFVLPENVREMTDQELAVWYNDNIIYPDKVRLNKYYYEHYSFVKDIQMIFATVLGFKVDFAGGGFDVWEENYNEDENYNENLFEGGWKFRK